MTAHLREQWRARTKQAEYDYRGQHQPPDDGAPLHDLLADDNSWFPDDVYDHPEYYDHGGQDYDRESARILRQVRGKPNATVAIYRAVPPVYYAEWQPGVEERERIEVPHVINPGDWVAIAPSYARNHSDGIVWEEWVNKEWVQHEGGIVLTAQVPAHTVRNGGNDIIEWGYWGPAVPARVV